MRWQGLFFTLLFMRFGTLFGAPNEPKTRLRDLAKSTIIKYYAPDGSSEGFLAPDAKRCILQETILVILGVHFGSILDVQEFISLI